MILLATHPRSKYGIGLGFKRVNVIQWALSKLFPYKRPSLIGQILVHQNVVNIQPRMNHNAHR